MNTNNSVNMNEPTSPARAEQVPGGVCIEKGDWGSIQEVEPGLTVFMANPDWPRGLGLRPAVYDGIEEESQQTLKGLRAGKLLQIKVTANNKLALKNCKKIHGTRYSSKGYCQLCHNALYDQFKYCFLRGGQVHYAVAKKITEKTLRRVQGELEELMA